MTSNFSGGVQYEKVKTMRPWESIPARYIQSCYAYNLKDLNKLA